MKAGSWVTGFQFLWTVERDTLCGLRRPRDEERVRIVHIHMNALRVTGATGLNVGHSKLNPKP
jgi:hypothetical protein